MSVNSTPTHVQVTVQRARGLLQKGKNGTNDAFVTISLGKERYQTSVKEKSADPVEWQEECLLPIPRQGNKADIVLSVLHQNYIGDEFLGQISIPLAEFDVNDKSKTKWYELKSKPGHDKKNKYRGEIEVKVHFTAPPLNAATSLADINKKDGIKASLGQLSSKMGGSLISLGKEKKGSIKNLAKAVGHKMSTLPGRGKKKPKDDTFGSIPEQSASGLGVSSFAKIQTKVHSVRDADPGVISDDEDEFRFEELSHRSSHSSLSVSQVALSTPKDGSLENLGGGEFLRRNYATPPPIKPPKEKPVDKAQQRWSSGPVDDWESKLFGKQYSFEKSKPESPTALQTQQEEEKEKQNEKKVEKKVEIKAEKKEEIQPSPEVSLRSKQIVVPIPSTPKPNKEPVPKPRQVQTVTKFEETSAVGKPTPEVVQPNQTPPIKAKDSIRSSVKESLASIFGGSKQEDDNKMGTPVAVTNPIRMKDSHHHEPRLPREILKKYEAKSREDLIEIVINQQATLEYQKHKLTDMEDYIDNLVARVIETHPTLLQSPFVTRHTLK